MTVADIKSLNCKDIARYCFNFQNLFCLDILNGAKPEYEIGYENKNEAGYNLFTLDSNGNFYKKYSKDGYVVLDLVDAKTHYLQTVLNRFFHQAYLNSAKITFENIKGKLNRHPCGCSKAMANKKTIEKIVALQDGSYPTFNQNEFVYFPNDFFSDDEVLVITKDPDEFGIFSEINNGKMISFSSPNYENLIEYGCFILADYCFALEI